LQVLADGLVDLVVDGTVFWRSPYRIPRELLRPVYLSLGFQSFQTAIAHGTLLVYGAPKYRLPETSGRGQGTSGHRGP
jgi:hypothetical protein